MTVEPTLDSCLPIAQMSKSLLSFIKFTEKQAISTPQLRAVFNVVSAGAFVNVCALQLNTHLLFHVLLAFALVKRCPARAFMQLSSN